MNDLSRKLCFHGKKTPIVSSLLFVQTLFVVKSLKCLCFSSQESLGLSSAVSTPEVERRYDECVVAFLVFLIQSLQAALVPRT